MEWVMIGLGLALLLLAGDALVKGAVNLSLRLGIPALIVGLTVVAFGTSAPELLVSIEAVRKGAPDIALGNVIGSNIANILLVLGLPALVAGLACSKCDARRSYVTMLIATIFFMTICMTGRISQIEGLLMLSVLAGILFLQYREARAHRSEMKAAETSAVQANSESDAEDDLEGADPSMPIWRILVFLVIGVIGLPLGADLLVDGAVVVAINYGLSERVIGLTLVALGTSLPELATTLVAAVRRNADVAIGNVLGSNMFNMLAILGVASLFGGIPVDPDLLRSDLWLMLGASLLLIPFAWFRHDMGRLAGAVLFVLYLLYIVLLFM